MGQLVDGKWVKKSIITSDEEGSYDRIPRSFLDKISKDHEKFTPESGRYHLYVSYACPWAQRTLIFRYLKQLEAHIDVSVVHPHMLENGWTFDTGLSGTTSDKLYDKNFLYEIYQQADSKISTSVTVPILWDKKNKTIVNNESSQIIRIFNSAFNDLTGDSEDYYPVSLREEIDSINERVYHNVNNGVYKAGFAQNQNAYDDAVTKLFQELEHLERHLEDREYLVGDQLTEADVRLITTLVRFDVVYHVHFKCSQKKIAEYKNLGEYTRRLFHLPAIRNTTNFEHITNHYYYSHKEINPQRIIAKVDLEF